MNPSARTNGLFTVEVGDDLLVYDQDRVKAHALNPAAALVWRHCDGHTSIAELTILLQRELGLPADENVVWLALDRLERAHLLVEHVPRPLNAGRQTRRQVVQKLGLAGGLALLLPIVESITAPAPAMAQSGGTGGPCGPGGVCPPGFTCDFVTNTCVALIDCSKVICLKNADCLAGSNNQCTKCTGPPPPDNPDVFTCNP